MLKQVITLILSFSLLSPLIANEGLITKPSTHSTETTVVRLKEVLQKKKIRVFAHIKHQDNAKQTALTLNTIELLVFGNPKLGTPLMQTNPTIGIDLPMKILIREDHHGKVWLTYNDPLYLIERHELQAKKSIAEKMAAALDNITTTAAAQ